MPKSYSEDLRWRAVWLYIVRGMTFLEVADVLFMYVRSVQRYLHLFHSTGSVVKLVNLFRILATDFKGPD